MELMAFRNVSFKTDTFINAVLAILLNTSVVFQLGRLYCAPSL